MYKLEIHMFSRLVRHGRLVLAASSFFAIAGLLPLSLKADLVAHYKLD
jgi:hypothetical protein